MTSTAAPKPTDQTEEPRGEIDLGILNEIIGFRIRRIQNHLSRSLASLLGDDDLRPGAFSTLALIAANPGLSQIALSREVGFDKASVVAILDSLEARGWTRRQRSTTDRRRHHLFVTPEGEKALDRMADLARANEAEAHATLTSEEQKALGILLDKLYRAVAARSSDRD